MKSDTIGIHPYFLVGNAIDLTSTTPPTARVSNGKREKIKETKEDHSRNFVLGLPQSELWAKLLEVYSKHSKLLKHARLHAHVKIPRKVHSFSEN